MIQAQPLDICTQGLYSSWSYDYPMDSQINLFRYLNQSSHSSSNSSVSPLIGKAKRFYDLDLEEKKKIYFDIINKQYDYKYLLGYIFKKYNVITDYYLIYRWFKKGVKPYTCSERMKLLNKTNNPSKNQKIHEETTKNRILKRLDKYKNLKINENTHQILLGSLLGDGSLSIQKWSPRFTESHCMEQKDYLEWKSNYLERDNIPLYKRRVIYKQNGKRINYPMWHIESKYIPQLFYYHYLFYSNKKKEINWKILQQLEPLGLAVWYMDDGSLYTKRGTNEISIATHCFPKEQLESVKYWIKFRWNIDITIRPSDNTIYIKANSIQKFINLIKPYVPKCMKYKIKINPIKKIYCWWCSKQLFRYDKRYCNTKCEYKYKRYKK